MYSCGYFGYLRPVDKSVQEYIYDLSAEACNWLTETGSFRFLDTITITQIRRNDITTHSIDIAGSADG